MTRSPADAPIVILSITSDVYDQARMYDAATQVWMSQDWMAGRIGHHLELQCVAGGIEQEHGVIARAFHQNAEAFLAFAQLLLVAPASFLAPGPARAVAP